MNAQRMYQGRALAGTPWLLLVGIVAVLALCIWLVCLSGSLGDAAQAAR